MTQFKGKTSRYLALKVTFSGQKMGLNGSIQ